MRSKVAAAEMASEAGIGVVICNGTQDGMLARAAAGDAVGTRFAPHPSPDSGLELWRKHWG